MKVKSLSHVRLSQPHGLQPTRLLPLWEFPGKSTGVGCHCLLHNLKNLKKWLILVFPSFLSTLDHAYSSMWSSGGSIVMLGPMLPLIYRRLLLICVILAFWPSAHSPYFLLSLLAIHFHKLIPKIVMTSKIFPV